MFSRSNRPARFALPLIFTTITVISLPACSKKTHYGFWTKTSLEGDLVIALENPSPNQRLQALIRIINYNRALPDVAYDTLSTIARTDKNTQVRSAAVRALQSHLAPPAVEPIVQILLYKNFPQQVIPPTPQVKWDAFVALSDACDRGMLPDSDHDPIRDLLIQTLLSREDRNVRMIAAYTLRHFPTRPALESLIGAVREEDFGICYEAEHALIAMTGTTHQHDADAWVAWLAQVADPFEHAGQTPDGLPGPYRSQWRKNWDSFKGRMAWWKTGQDE